MAINTHDELWKNEPYVHSKILNFRMNAKEINSQYIKDSLTEAVTQLEIVRDNLKKEAEGFLGNKTWKEASMELFNNPKTYSGIAFKILRSTGFLNKILTSSAIDLSDPTIKELFTDRFMSHINDSLDTIEVGDIAELIANKMKTNNTDKTIQISVAGKKVFKNKTIQDIVSSKKGFKYVRNTDGSHERLIKNLTKYLNSKTGTNWEEVWQYFRSSFLNIIKQENIVFSYNNFTPEQYLEELYPVFIAKVQQAYAKDVSNATGVIGENIKDAVLSVDRSEASLTLKFHNVGNLTLEELQTKDFAKSIEIIRKSKEEDKKGASDWVIYNSQTGKTIQAQDKNSIVLLERIKREENIPQALKVQDTIKYTTLMQQMKDYGSLLSEDDWAILEYYIVNIVWQRKTPNDFNNQFNTRIVDNGYQYRMSGIQEQINKILSKNISYLLGVNIKNLSKDLSEIAYGSSNTFFIIDNLFIYPTYLIIDNIIKDLKNEDSLAKIYATFDLSSVTVDAKSLWERKLDVMAASPWDGGEYGEQMLNVGKEAGREIINKLNISRINTKLNVNAILKSSLSNIDLSKI